MMGDESINNQWNSSTSFIIAMIGAIIGLAGIWRFSYLIYENGGGSFLIPYILAIVIMAIPLLVLEFSVGYRFKSSLPKIFYNMKSEFEIVAWFIIFLIFIVLIYYSCIMSWDLIYVVLSLFKGWGNNPSVFFTNTLLHSSSSPYGLTYLVVPIGIGLILIWAMIYLVSRKEINKGIALLTKISLFMTFAIVIGLLVFSLQLPGSRTGVMALFNPNWEYLLDLNIWLTAFGQLIFSYGLAYGIASTYASYLPDNVKLIDSAWIVVLISLVFEIIFSVLVFALLGYMALGKNISITSLVSDGFSLIFVVFPNVFNVMGPWVYIVAPAFFLSIFLGGIGALFALMEPLSNSICDKFNWDKERAVRNLVLIGLFASFLFATGMGEYLLRIVDGFISQFAIIFVVLLELVVFGWVFDLEELCEILNENSFIKLDKSWIILIKFVIPIILAIIWILGVYNLILAGDRQSLLIQSILASIIVLVPVALTVIPFKGDYDVDISNGRNGFNYFRDGEDVSKDKSKVDSINRRVKSRSKDKSDDLIDKTIDDYRDRAGANGVLLASKGLEDELSDNAESDSEKHSIFSFDKFKRSKNGKNVLNNVDLSSKEFDSVPDDEDYFYGRYDDGSDDFNSDNHDSKSLKSENKSRSLFEKINLFNKNQGSDEFIDDDYGDYNDSEGYNNYNNYDDSEDYDNLSDYENDDDFDFIAPIRDSEDERSGKRQHKFRSSKDFDGFDNLEDGSSKPKSRSRSKSKNNSKSNSKSSSGSKTNSKSDARSKSSSKSKSDANSKAKSKANSEAKSKSKSESKPKVEIKEVEEEEYEEFTDDFFDDGVFGDEGYEALLDDYVEPKPKRNGKAKKDSSSDNNQKKATKSDGNPYYDFEGKGADSVFRLDD